MKINEKNINHLVNKFFELASKSVLYKRFFKFLFVSCFQKIIKVLPSQCLSFGITFSWYLLKGGSTSRVLLQALK